MTLSLVFVTLWYQLFWNWQSLLLILSLVSAVFSCLTNSLTMLVILLNHMQLFSTVRPCYEICYYVCASY
jgi:hypothetical protein